MGRIKDLKDKVSKGEATDEEKVELEELVEEAKVEDEETKDDEKSINDFVDKIMNAVEAKQAKAEKIVEEKKIEKETGFEAEYKAMDGDKQIVSFIKALRDNDVAKLKVMSAGSSADGGYLVPTILYQRIVEEQREDAVIASRATVIDPCPASLNIDQLVGRPKMSWTAEKAVKDTSTATFNQITLTPYNVTCIVVITNKLEEDAEVVAPLSNYVTGLMATALNEELERVFAVGGGTTQPTGLHAYAATNHRIIATPANVLTTGVLIDAVTRAGTKYLRNAVWLMNSAAYRKAMNLLDGQSRPIFIADPTGKIPGTILGYPVLRCDALPDSEIWFGDLKGYWIGYRGGISVDKSTDATIEGVGNLFERNMFAIRVERRVDAELADLDAMVVITGAN